MSHKVVGQVRLDYLGDDICRFLRGDVPHEFLIAVGGKIIASIEPGILFMLGKIDPWGADFGCRPWATIKNDFEVVGVIDQFGNPKVNGQRIPDYIGKLAHEGKSVAGGWAVSGPPISEGSHIKLPYIFVVLADPSLPEEEARLFAPAASILRHLGLISVPVVQS